MESRASHEGPTMPMNPQPEKASLVEDFMDILYSPTKVFERRSGSGFGTYLLIITVVAGLFAFATRGVFSQIFDAEFQRGAAKAMAANPQITMDQMNSMRGIQEKIGMVATYIGTPIFIFILAFFTWIAAMITGAKVKYGQAVLVVCLAWIPRLVGSLVGTLQVVLMDTSNVVTPWALGASPARFMADDANPKVLALAAGFDLITIWYTVVAGIGLAVLAKSSPAKGYIASFIVFVLGLLPALAR